MPSDRASNHRPTIHSPSTVKILLTNDDGYDAAGLETLFNALTGLGELMVVAPDRPQSGVGHRVTTKQPLTLNALEPGRYKVDGTPADCARIALTFLAADADWLISGINRGGNLGADTYISGTVAAAREAALLGIKSMAVSQYVAPGRSVDWDLTGRRAGKVISTLMSVLLAPGEFWNVNLPHPEHSETGLAMVFCGLDSHPLDVRFRENNGKLIYDGNYHSRPHSPDKDIAACFSGKVSVSRVRL